MKKIYLFASFVFALFFTQLALASDSCSKVGEISGKIRSTNISDSIQSGSIKVKIKVDGRIYYASRGRVIGRIIEQGIDTGTGQPYAILNHNIFLGWRTVIATSNDQAVLVPTRFYDGAPCAFNVVQELTSAVGSNRLRSLTNDEHHVKAKGSISYCPGSNRNTFELSGTVCIN
jgi:hypothetical protein